MHIPHTCSFFFDHVVKLLDVSAVAERLLMCVCVCVCARARARVRVHVYLHARTHTRTDAQALMLARTHTHTHTHTHGNLVTTSADDSIRVSTSLFSAIDAHLTHAFTI